MLSPYFKLNKKIFTMNYFAKYLPVEGEIKKSKYVLYKGEVYRHLAVLNNKDANVYTFIKQDGADRGYHEKWEDLKEIKLFICSTEVQVGDAVWSYYSGENEYPYGEVTVDAIEVHIAWDKNGYEHTPSQLFKVIGEISPNATWVKEGDEFNEDQISTSSFIKSVEKKNSKWVFIKGCCGHFH